MIALQITWLFIIALLLIGFTILDGFDFGIGCWHLFAKKGEERRAFLAALGPFWDGNEVWLIAGGACIFAAFPAVYATTFSGFYLALLLILLALIFRGVSIEFGAHEQAERQYRWDVGFAVGSILAALLFGVAFGNILRGLPLDRAGDFHGNLLTLLNPFSLLVGVLNLVMLALHGALFLTLKLEGALAQRVSHWARNTWSVFLPLTLATGIIAYAVYPHLRRNFLQHPVLWMMPALTLAAIILAGVWNARQRPGMAFTASSLSIALVLGTAIAALFPSMVPAWNAAYNLTIYNSSSSLITLRAMLILALIGLPIVMGYSIWVYWTFRGKVKIGESHY